MESLSILINKFIELINEKVKIVHDLLLFMNLINELFISEYSY